MLLLSGTEQFCFNDKTPKSSHTPGNYIYFYLNPPLQCSASFSLGAFYWNTRDTWKNMDAAHFNFILKQ
jgi:hypothetical protein